MAQKKRRSKWNFERTDNSSYVPVTDREDRMAISIINRLPGATLRALMEQLDYTKDFLIHRIINDRNGLTLGEMLGHKEYDLFINHMPHRGLTNPRHMRSF